MAEIKILATGKYGIVKVIKHENELFVKKIYKNLEHENNGVSFDFIREVAILKNISDPNIISLLDIDYQNFNYIILPYYSCNLAQFLTNNKYMRDIDLRTIFRKICLGIYKLHSSGIVHRDLKPSNICVSHIKDWKNLEDVSIVLIDKGMSRKINYNNLGELTPEITTIWFRAPEIIWKKTNYSFAVDIWAAGCILAKLYTGKNLFPFDSDFILLNEQSKLVGTPSNINLLHYPGQLDKYFSKYGFEFFQLLEGMLKFDPKERFTIAKCLNSIYFGQFEFCETKIIYENYLKNWKSPYYYIEDKVNNKITFKKRKFIVKWLSDFCEYYILPESTFFTSVVLLDFFSIITDFSINMDNYELVAVSVLLIVSKLDAVHPLSVLDLVQGDEINFTHEKILEMEKIILKSCQFDILFPDFSNYISVFAESYEKLDLAQLNNNLKKCLMEPDYLKYPFYHIVKSCIDVTCDCKPFDGEYINCYNNVKIWISN